MGCKRETSLPSLGRMADLTALFENRPDLLVIADLRFGLQDPAGQHGGDTENPAKRADLDHQS